MKGLKAVLLVVLGVALGIVLTGVQAGVDCLVLVRPQPYLSALRSSGFFEDLPDLVADALSSQIELPAAERVKVSSAMHEAFPPDWVEAQVSAMVGDITSVLAGREAELTTVLPASEISDRFLQAYAKTASPVGLVRATMAMEKLKENGDLSLGRGLIADPAVLEAAAKYVRTGSAYTAILAGLGLVLVLLIFLLAGGLPGGAGWTGAACLVSGAVALVASFLAGRVTGGLAQSLGIEGLSEAAAGQVHGAITALANAVVGTVRLTAVVVVAAGVILLVVAGVAKAARVKRGTSGRATAR